MSFDKDKGKWEGGRRSWGQGDLEHRSSPSPQKNKPQNQSSDQLWGSKYGVQLSLYSLVHNAYDYPATAGAFPIWFKNFMCATTASNMNECLWYGRPCSFAVASTILESAG